VLGVRTKAGLDRFVTFIDAVVAIAITLLVLPLVDLARTSANPTDLGDLLSPHGGLIFSFLLSFTVIARLWLGHHALLLLLLSGPTSRLWRRYRHGEHDSHGQHERVDPTNPVPRSAR
jgi:hypothetical protein